MSGENLTSLISAFVGQARAANDSNKVRHCVDEALTRLQATGQSKPESLRMLFTAVVSTTQALSAEANPTKYRADANALTEVFSELQQRRRSLT
jgi:hypothetical protein